MAKMTQEEIKRVNENNSVCYQSSNLIELADGSGYEVAYKEEEKELYSIIDYQFITKFFEEDLHDFMSYRRVAQILHDARLPLWDFDSVVEDDLTENDYLNAQWGMISKWMENEHNFHTLMEAINLANAEYDLLHAIWNMLAHKLMLSTKEYQIKVLTEILDSHWIPCFSVEDGKIPQTTEEWMYIFQQVRSLEDLPADLIPLIVSFSTDVLAGVWEYPYM